MIALGKLAGLREHDHRLTGCFPRCGRWSVLPLAELVAQGQGPRRLPIVVRCRVCGEFGPAQLRPPVPTVPLASGWI